MEARFNNASISRLSIDDPGMTKQTNIYTINHFTSIELL